MSAPKLPASGGPLLAFAMAVIHPYFLTAYRIRGWGRLPRKRGATLLITNHQHDLDTTGLIMRLSVQGPWMHPIYTTGSRRMFEPGFMEVRVAWIRRLVALVDWAWMFRMLGVLPIENELRRRSVAAIAWAVYRRHGDLPATDVFGERAMKEVRGATTLRQLVGRTPLEPKEYVSIATLREPYRQEVLDELRDQVEADLTLIESVLRADGTLYLTAEGRYTTDGRLSRFRASLPRLAPLGDIYLLALSYDPFVAKRLSLLYRVVKPYDPADLRASLAAARPVTFSQVFASWLHDRDSSFTRDEALAGVRATLASVPQSAFVDPEFAANPARLLDAALRWMTRSGLLSAGDDGTYRRGAKRTDQRFPLVPDILVHQTNHFAETISACARMRSPATASAPSSR